MNAKKEKVKKWVNEHRDEIITGVYGGVLGCIGLAVGYKYSQYKIGKKISDGKFITEPCIINCLEAADKITSGKKNLTTYYTDTTSFGYKISEMGQFGIDAVKNTPYFNNNTVITNAILIGVNEE